MVEILDNVPPEDRATKSLTFDDNDSVGINVLGHSWSHRDDTFHYVLQPIVLIMAKRGMLSLIARIFDPLCFLAPVIFCTKHLMQRVWQTNLGWDDQLPSELSELWRKFVDNLPAIQQLKIPHFVGTQRGIHYYLCEFCDASEKGYSAVVYLKLIDKTG